MRRKTSTIPTKIYTYGLPLGPEAASAPLVDAQIDAAHAYTNTLIEIERWRRARYRELMAQQSPVIALDARIGELEKELVELRQALKVRRSEARTRVPADKPKSDRIKVLRAELKVARGERRAAQKDLREAAVVQTALAEIADEALAKIKAARAATPCYWGTYLLVERAMDAARKSATDPRFRRWSDGALQALDGRDKPLRYQLPGRIGVQLQGGLTVAALHAGTDTRLRIAAVPDNVYRQSRGVRRRETRTTLQIRVGSEGRAPVWATFPVILHRPLPSDGVIKEAWVQRRAVGRRWRYTLQIALESQTFAVAPRLKGPTCAIDLGWRVRPDGLRVGYVVGTDGLAEEILLPESILSGIRHPDHLRSISQVHFDQTRAMLVTWLSVASPPPWLAEATEHLGQWRSQARLEQLVLQWARRRFPGDDMIFATLDTWRRRFRHLSQWQDHQRIGRLGSRREHYRLIAARLARRYSTIVLEELDLRQLKRLPLPEAEAKVPEAVRHNQHLAAVGELRGALTLSAANAGARIVCVPSIDTTAICHACGCLCKWDHAAILVHRCEHCGARWDQDANAARNLLARASGSLPPRTQEPLAASATH